MTRSSSPFWRQPLSPARGRLTSFFPSRASPLAWLVRQARQIGSLSAGDSWTDAFFEFDAPLRRSPVPCIERAVSWCYFCVLCAEQPLSKMRVICSPTAQLWLVPLRVVRRPGRLPRCARAKSQRQGQRQGQVQPRSEPDGGEERTHLQTLLLLVAHSKELPRGRRPLTAARAGPVESAYRCDLRCMTIKAAHAPAASAQTVVGRKGSGGEETGRPKA